MNYSNEVKAINDFISKSNIDEVAINDFKIWPFIRLAIIDRILIKKGVFGVRNHSRLRLTDLLHIIANTLVSCVSLLKVLFLGRRKFLFVGFSRRTLEGKNYIDKFHDPIIEQLNSRDCVMLERPYNKKHSRNRTTECPIVNIDFFVYFSEFVSRITCSFYRLKYKSEIEEFSNKLAPIYSDKAFVAKLLSREIAKFQVQNLFNKFFIKVFKPEKVIVTNRGLHLSLLYCANKAQIETSELQHGITLANDISYTNQNDGLLGINKFLTFGEYWCEGYQWAGDETEVLSFGFQYINNRRNALSLSCKSRELLTRKILVVSQPELHSQINNDLHLLAKTNIDCKFIIKLHPQDFQGYEKRYSLALSNENVTVFSESSCDNYSLFSQVDCVFGYNSTMLYEAHYFGCSVYIINFSNQDLSLIFGKSIECFSEITQPVIDFDSEEGCSVGTSENIGELFFSSRHENMIYEFFKGGKYEKNI